ncbi:MAG: hypothetical protein ACP5SK_05320, partial [Thermoprotei archaeon]
SLTLSSNATSVVQGSPVVLTATATFPNGTPASGYSVGFFANGAGIGTGTTGANGQATLTYTPASSGTYTLTADLTSAPSVTSNSVSLTVTSKTTVTPPPTTPTTSNATLYAVVAGVIVVIVVVAAVLALSRRGKKGPQSQPQQQK